MDVSHTRAPPDSHSAGKAAFEATPILAGDLLYIITPFNQVIALDPETRTERWRSDPGIASAKSYSEVTSRGVAVANGRVFFGTIDGRVIAVDARTGRLLWQITHGNGNSNGNYQITSRTER